MWLWFEMQLCGFGVVLKLLVEMFYLYIVCEFVLVGVGVGFVYLLVVFDFVQCGFVVWLFDVDVVFIGVLVFCLGMLMLENVCVFFQYMWIQLEVDWYVLVVLLGRKGWGSVWGLGGGG